jgi:hypothetical protein
VASCGREPAARPYRTTLRTVAGSSGSTAAPIWDSPVTHDTQAEVGAAPSATAICSGAHPVTRRCTRGSVPGRSTACPLFPSGTVTGRAGPDSVDAGGSAAAAANAAASSSRRIASEQ